MAYVLSMALGFLFYFYVLLLQNSQVQVQNRQMPGGYKDYCTFGQRECIFNVKSAYRKLKSTTTSTGRAFWRGRILLYRNGTATFQPERIKPLGTIHPNPGPNRNILTTNPQTADQRSLYASVGPNCSSHVLEGMQNNKTKLSVFYANARSIVNKIDLFHLEITERSYDIIALTEAHLDDSILDSEIFPCNYTVFRRDRLHNGRHGGGATRDNGEAIMKEDFLTYIS